MLPFFADLTHEEFFCIFLNRANKGIKINQILKGGISGTVTDVRILFKNSVLDTASGLIVAHNHPSGNLNFAFDKVLNYFDKWFNSSD